ncbi:MAG: hypothetical protein M1832_001649 [Thelocarpon impressellum]|nr:MAG: hypothetical protein M1832_001649 [Thelocarpon impressellum]
MVKVLVVGASRGLGASVAERYARAEGNQVFATTRAASAPAGSGGKNTTWITAVDVAAPTVGQTLVSALQQHENAVLDIVVITAGYFGKETFDAPDHEKQIRMYTTSAIGPVFVVQGLVKAGLVKENGGKVVLVSSESGSITLRHESEGGGNYGHHASKAALNMVGKLLSLDLADKGIVVLGVHPGFMRTEMTKSVGFDEFWDAGGAVTPDEAATSLIDFVNALDMSKTGEFWAPRGPRDIGTAEAVLGTGLPTPLKLPW